MPPLPESARPGRLFFDRPARTMGTETRPGRAGQVSKQIRRLSSSHLPRSRSRLGPLPPLARGKGRHRHLAHQRGAVVHLRRSRLHLQDTGEMTAEPASGREKGEARGGGPVPVPVRSGPKPSRAARGGKEREKRRDTGAPPGGRRPLPARACCRPRTARCRRPSSGGPAGCAAASPAQAGGATQRRGLDGEGGKGGLDGEAAQGRRLRAGLALACGHTRSPASSRRGVSYPSGL